MSKTLVYDGDCPMCRWISRRFAELGLISESQRRPFQEFSGERARAMEAAGIRNEMLVLDPASGELRAGIAGFLWLLEDTRLSGFAPILAVAPIRGLLRLVYRTIAYNRRVLAPPERQVVCDCEPDPHLGFRALFLMALFSFVAAGAVVCGLAVDRAFGIGGAVPSLVGTLVAVAALVLGGRLVGRSSVVHLAGNALMVVSAGLLAALPAVVVSFAFERSAAWLLLVIGAMLGVAFGLRSLIRRMGRLRTGSARRATPA